MRKGYWPVTVDSAATSCGGVPAPGRAGRLVFALWGLFHTVLKLTVVLGPLKMALRLGDEPVVADRPQRT